MAMRTVIVHDMMGIFLGVALGLGFWSLLEPAGQVAAVCFDSEEDARNFVSLWEVKTDPDIFRYVSVESENGEWASISELIKGGLGDLTALMLENSASMGQA